MRFSTDKSKVKNPESKQTIAKNTEIDQPSAIIFDMITKSDSLDKLKEIWESYPNYQRNQAFKKAINNAKTKFELQPAS